MHAPTSEAKQSTAKQSKAKRSKAKQSETKQSNAKQSEATQSKAKQSKAKQSKAKQREAKQSEAKQRATEPLKKQFLTLGKKPLCCTYLRKKVFWIEPPFRANLLFGYVQSDPERTFFSGSTVG